MGTIQPQKKTILSQLLVSPWCAPHNALNTVATYYLIISVICIFTWWALALAWEKSFLLTSFLRTEELWGCIHCKFVVRRLCCSMGGLMAFVSSIWSYLGKSWVDLPDVTMWVRVAGSTPDTDWCLGMPSGWADRLAATLDVCALSKVDLPGGLECWESEKSPKVWATLIRVLSGTQ